MNTARKPNVTKINSTYMETFHKKANNRQKKRKGLIRRLTLFGLILVILLFSLGTKLIEQQAVLQTKQAEKKALEERLVQLGKEQEKLRSEIILLNNEDYIAKIARRDYYLSKDGETIFKIPEDSPSY